MSKQEKSLDEKIEESYFIMAKIVRDHGEKYLPLFKRIHEERELRKANLDLKNIALQIANIEVDRQ